MMFGNVTRSAIGLVTANVIGSALVLWAGVPSLWALVIGGVVGAFAMVADLSWITFCVWFWPSRLRRFE